MSKTLPTPGGGSDLTAMLRQRHVDTDQPNAPGTAQAAPAPRRPAEKPAEQVPAGKRPAGTEMDRRSWYMPKASADALAAMVDELHWQTRQPKQAVLAAIIEVSTQHLDQVAKKLKHR